MSREASPTELMQHSQWVLSLARRLVGETGADDIVQQTMNAALRRPPLADQPIQPWLAKVTRRFAAKWGRSAARRRQHESAAAELRRLEVPSAAELAESADLLHRLVNEVNTLSPHLREVVTLRFMRDLTSREIGKRLGLPAGTVRWRLSQGLDELRLRLDKHCGGDRNRWATALAAVTIGTLMPPTVSTASVACIGALAVAALGWIVWSYYPTAVSPNPSAPEVSTVSTEGSRATDSRQEEVEATAPERTVAADLARSPAPSPRVQTLPAGTSGVHVRLVDAAGAPLTGAEIQWPDGVDAFAFTGADGHAWLTLRPPSDRAHLELLLQASGLATLRVSSTAQIGAWQDLGVVALPGAARLYGRALDEQRRPIENAIVFATHANLPQPVASYREIGPAALNDFLVEPTTTAADGTFSMAMVPALPVRVWVVTRGRCFASSAELRPTANANLQIDDLVCDPLPPGSAIHGQVVDADSAPIAGARVRYSALIHRSDDPSGLLRNQWLETGADGRFEVPARVGLRFELMVEAPGFTAQRLPLVTPADRVMVTLMRDG